MNSPKPKLPPLQIRRLAIEHKQGRPKGFEPSKKTRAAIAKYRRSKKWTPDVKEKIGAGVRHGDQNKEVFSTKIDPGIAARFREKVSERGMKISRATEGAFEDWSKKKSEGHS